MLVHRRLEGTTMAAGVGQTPSATVVAARALVLVSLVLERAIQNYPRGDLAMKPQIASRTRVFVESALLVPKSTGRGLPVQKMDTVLRVAAKVLQRGLFA